MKHDRETRLDQELQFHIDQQVAAYVRGGMDEKEARRMARLEFGGVEQIKEDCRDARPSAWADEIARDLRQAVASFRRSPVPVGTVITILGLAIGVSSAHTDRETQNRDDRAHGHR